ncbi:hypothetical protein [Promineifilum sp.]|uniref:hypothetical protein n=1 Tax=Promineifilum sp. TaxID=2664178 RepID=UPI0035B358EA
MTWFLLFLGASVFCSIFVLAAGMLSSRMNRREQLVENFYTEVREKSGNAPATE